MRIRSLVAATACCVASLACSAQIAPTAQSIEAQLQGPFLMLRGMYDGSKLKFDAQGNLVGNAKLLPFSLSALRLNKVKVTDSSVEIDTRREGLDFQDGQPKAEDRGAGNLKVTIAWDSQHPQDLHAALEKVFSVAIDQALIDAAPECWRPYLKGEAGLPAQFLRAANGTPAPRTPGGAVTSPRLLFAPDPNPPRGALGTKFTGTAVIGLIVDASGTPREVHVVRPLGMGFDEAAVEAVEQYRFAPAQYEGKPVPVQINIEVNFRIW